MAGCCNSPLRAVNACAARALQEQKDEYEAMVARVEHRQRCIEQMDIAMWKRRYLEGCALQDKAFERVMTSNKERFPLRSQLVVRFLPTTTETLLVNQAGGSHA